jgi:hypothetical protein
VFLGHEEADVLLPDPPGRPLRRRIHRRRGGGCGWGR